MHKSFVDFYKNKKIIVGLFCRCLRVCSGLEGNCSGVLGWAVKILFFLCKIM